MSDELVERFEEMEPDCSKCPIAQQDCQWMAETFQQPDKPPGKAKKWCPLLVTIGSIMALLDLGAQEKPEEAEIVESPPAPLPP